MKAPKISKKRMSIEDYKKFVGWQDRSVEFENKIRERCVQILGYVDENRVKLGMSNWFQLNVCPI